jgi:molybdopterin molybdotransferase
MFHVTPLAEALTHVMDHFSGFLPKTEKIKLSQAMGCYLSGPVRFDEFVPDFNRSTVDGYALRAEDIRGCSESNPGILHLIGGVEMGKVSGLRVDSMATAMVPTGAEVPTGADAVVMIEYTEKFGENEIAVLKPVAPGANMIFRGDDGKPGEVLFPEGHRLSAADIGSLAALGVTEVEIFSPLKLGILSTGDELVKAEKKPNSGQVRDVNSPLLEAFTRQMSFEPVVHEFISDQETLLEKALGKLCESTDCVLVSGGTSVGVRDNLARVIVKHGHILIHGLAVKPGKPTIVADIGGKPVIGLPGNPVAAYFITRMLVKPLLLHMIKSQEDEFLIPAQMASAFSSNQGREEFVLVRLEDGIAHPIPSKSGLITNVSRANGFIRIPRDSEGLAKDAKVSVIHL